MEWALKRTEPDRTLQRVRPLRIAPVLAAVLALAACSSSPSTPVNCPANAIAGHFTLLTSSASHPNPSLRLCARTTCSKILPSAPNQFGELESGSTELSIFAPAPGQWTVAVLNGRRPRELTVELHAGRTEFASRRVALDWRRGDPSDTCHEWKTTGPVTIQVR